MTLPPDPNKMNTQRAVSVLSALNAFAECIGSEPGHEPEDLLCDLLCNLAHWADRNDMDFDAEMQRAQMHYEAETAEETIKIGDTLCTLDYAKYSNDRVALKLTCAAWPHDPYCGASVNLPDAYLDEDEICIKDWDDDGVIMRALITAGIISEPVRTIPSGYVQVNVCKLLTYETMPTA